MRLEQTENILKRVLFLKNDDIKINLWLPSKFSLKGGFQGSTPVSKSKCFSLLLIKVKKPFLAFKSVFFGYHDAKWGLYFAEKAIFCQYVNLMYAHKPKFGLFCDCSFRIFYCFSFVFLDNFTLSTFCVSFSFWLAWKLAVNYVRSLEMRSESIIGMSHLTAFFAPNW